MNLSKIITFSLGLGIFFQLSLVTSSPAHRAPVTPTCLLNKNLSSEVEDLCLAAGSEDRQYEYLMCSPANAELNQPLKTHYIVQTKWDNKDDGTGQRLTNLFLGFSRNANAQATELEYITLIDDELEVQESSDLSFSSPMNGIIFDLTILSSDGDYLEGTVLDLNTQLKTEIECRDIATQSSSKM